jgi:hypothetical protein
MQRQPGESDNDYFGRVYQARRARRLSDLERARAEALLKGKEPFEYQRFREAYLHVKPYAPEPLELELDYYLNHRSAQTLEQYMNVVRETDLYDGGDMHLDRE